MENIFTDPYAIHWINYQRLIIYNGRCEMNQIFPQKKLQNFILNEIENI